MYLYEAVPVPKTDKRKSTVRYVICLHIISIIAGGLLGNVMMMGKELKTKSIEEETTTCTGTMTGWSRHNLCCVNTS